MTRYRKLPGHRRGIVNGASVWMAADHLLLVRSSRFSEQYKRYYLRDVQAVAIARKPRFHISTRALALGALWLFGYAILHDRVEWAETAFWVTAAALVGAWVYISAVCSCTCRIYTAVSRDTLPSVYRTWTARRFLRAVEPRISEVQGVMEGNWTEAAETKSELPPPAYTPAQPLPKRSMTSPAVYALLAGLAIEAAVVSRWMGSTSRLYVWTSIALNVAQVAAAVVILIQYHRNSIARAMQRLAIVVLVIGGAIYYLQQVTASAYAQLNRATAKYNVQARATPKVFYQITIAADIVLVLSGAALILRAKADA